MIRKINQQEIQTARAKKKPALQRWLSAFAIAIITFFVFSPSLKCDFTNYDDQDFIVQNPLVVNNSIETKKIFDFAQGNDYYPITIISFALNYQLGKLNPFGYHLWNVLLHIVNTLLVFMFILILTKRNLLMAAIVSLFFGIHPMHVESVTWITERKDVLFMFFFLAGLIAYLEFKESRKIVYYLISILLCVFSCLSKGTAVVFPAILILIDYLSDVKLNRKMFTEKIPFFLISITFIFITYLLHKSGTLRFVVDNRTLFQKLLFASYELLWYIIKLIIPINLSALYVSPNLNVIPITFYVSLFVCISITINVLIYLRKEKEIIFGLLFYFISVFLMLQFIQTGGGEFIVADRYNYLPSIGLLFLISYGLNRIWHKRKKSRFIIITITLIYALALCTQTYLRTKVWLNSETLWTDAINKDPKNCYPAYNSLGSYYSNEKNNSEKALALFNKALSIFPDYNDVLSNRGTIYFTQKKYDLAMADFNKSIHLDSNYTKAYNNRGLIFFYWGKYELAMKNYNKALDLDSNNADAYNNRGLIYYKKGEKDLAMKDYNKAIELKPNLDNAYYNRGLLYEYAYKQYDLALADYKKALELNPNYTEVYFYKGILLTKMGKNELAIGDFSKAIELDSSVPNYWLNRSYTENALGKKEKAKADALKAQQLGLQIDDSYLKELGIL